MVKSKHLKQQKVIWFTGLPSSGKTTLANKLGEILETEEIPFYILDGDNIRKELSQDLGFSFSDRVENNRRIACCKNVIPGWSSYYSGYNFT